MNVPKLHLGEILEYAMTGFLIGEDYTISIEISDMEYSDKTNHHEFKFKMHNTALELDDEEIYFKVKVDKNNRITYYSLNFETKEDDTFAQDIFIISYSNIPVIKPIY